MKTRGRIAAILLAAMLLPLARGQDRDLSLTPAGRRIGLVIGNESYTPAGLRTARNDATTVAQTLRGLGFGVSEHFNTRLQELEKAIDTTVASIKRGDVVVIYFAGLCLAVGNENYMLPSDFTPKDAADVKYTSYSAARLMDRIESAGPSAVVLFLDASNKNPYRLTPEVKTTPVPMSAGPSSHIVMAAAPGTTAFDIPESRNGLFAGFLSDAFQVPKATVGDVFKHLQEKVHWASGGLQTPVISSGGDTRIVMASASGANPAAQPPPAQATFESELKDWQRLPNAASEVDIRDFMSRYPAGRFQEAAALRLRSGVHREETVGSPAKAPAVTVPSNIEKMARATKPELDPTFDFVAADLELLAQVEALEKRLERDGLIESDPALNAYLNHVGQSILPTFEAPSRVKWRFGVVRDPIPNAFALPNGSIYVNSGMLAILDNESQLAGVLAHEITHVTGRHGYYANRDYRKKSTAMSIVQMAANYAPTGSDLTSSVVRSATQIAAVLVPALLNASILGYARELERNADIYAVDKLLDTGYDPREMIAAFRSLQEKHEVQLPVVYYNDHPKLEDRIKYLGVAIASLGVSASPLYATQAKQYREASRQVRFANIRWTSLAGQRRTALFLARRMMDAEPNSPDALIALADSYRALGPWTPEPTPSELSDKARKDTLKAKIKLTPQEEEAKLMQTAAGQSAWRENAKLAEELYYKALNSDTKQVEAYRSLGALFEKSGDISKARAAYQSFLEKAPGHPDSVRIQRKLETLRDTLFNRK